MAAKMPDGMFNENSKCNIIKNGDKKHKIKEPQN